MRYWWFLAALALLVAALLWQYPYLAHNPERTTNVAYLATMIAFIATSGALARLPLSRQLRDAAIWLGLILLAALAYSFRSEIKGTRLYGDLVPNAVQISADGNFHITRAEDGHFHVEAEVNGAPESFLIDTGASDIVLTQAAATDAGLEPETLNYSRTYATANGTVRGAPVVLQSLVVGTAHIGNIPASVNQGQLDESLLGMTFLNQFKSYRVENDQLTLTP